MRTILAATILIGGLALLPTADGGGAAQAATAQKGDELLIVDCLLPGKVRRLGTRTTYITARKGVKTTASDCAIRGGEYTELDRASYATALKIWLPLAQGGDAEAQTYLGEIYEKGLGVEPQYDAAAEWYRRAAEQGLSRAQIALGALYERGLGVAADPAEAMRWYRRASGLPDAVPYVPASVEAAQAELASERSALASERSRLTEDQAALQAERAELEKLRRELDDAQRLLQQRSGAAEATRRQVFAREQELELLRKKSGSDDKARAALLEQELQQGRAEAERQRRELDSLRGRVTALNQDVGRLQVSVRDEQQRRQAEVSEARDQAAAAKAELARMQAEQAAAEQALQQARQASAGRETDLAAAREALERERGAARRDESKLAALNEALAKREAELTAQRQAVAKLSGEVSALRERSAEAETKAAAVAVAAAEAPPPVKASTAPVIALLDPQLPVMRGIDVRPVVPIGGGEERLIIGKVDAPAGLLALIVNDSEQTPGANGVFRAKVTLTRPQTQVNIVAIDTEGRRSAMSFALAPQGAETGADKVRAAAAGQSLVKLALAQNISFGRFHALVIGNNAYRMLTPLKSAVGDAEAVAAVLRERYGFEVTLLLDADRYAVLSALNKLRETLTDDDNLLIYYAGHGELDRVNNRGHWLPVDAEPDSSANWISNIQITDVLNAMSARQIMVVADSCYSGTLTRSAVASLDSAMSRDARLNWIKVMTGKRARVVMSSGGVQPVLDQGGGDHSVFALAFLTALRGNADIMEGQKLFRSVAEQVTATAAAASVDQTPQFAPIKFAGHEAGDFFFVPRPGG